MAERPGTYLASALANDTQRDALVEFVDEILGGEERETDADGLIWLPIVSHTAPQVSLYVVLDPTPSEYVGIGVGARLTTATPGSFTSIHVPVCRAAKEDGGVDSPFLIGTADGVIRLTTDITLGTSPPLGGVALSLHLPTGGNATPTFGLTLRGLLLPGAAAARDSALTLDDLDELDDTVLELVLGLLRVQADAIGAGPLQSLVGLVGMSGTGSMPPLPLAELPTIGVPALATWFESVLSLPAARSEWLGHLAGMLDGAVAGDEVTLIVGDATITVGVKVTTGSGGHSVVTPTLSVHVAANASARARIDADLLQLDLATVTAIALPRLSAFLHLGRRPDGGSRLLSGDPQVDAVRAGLTLDASRRPTLLLAADGVVIAGNSYPTLDLSTPDAVAEVAGTVLGDVVDQLLLLLGPAEPAVRMIVGLSAPPSDPGVTLLEIPDFLADPLGAVRGYLARAGSRSRRCGAGRSRCGTRSGGRCVTSGQSDLGQRHRNGSVAHSHSWSGHDQCVAHRGHHAAHCVGDVVHHGHARQRLHARRDCGRSGDCGDRSRGAARDPAGLGRYDSDCPGAR